MPSESNLKRHLWSVAGTILAALLVQSASAVYWAGSVSARVSNCETALQRHDERIYRLEIGWTTKTADAPAKHSAPNL